jgi:uncharacterized protein
VSISAGDAAFLVAAGALAGAAGTAGGIASLISYPALLAVGIAPFPANVTNAVALITTGAGATVSSQPELTGQWPRLRVWAPLAVGGGVVGAVLLLVTPRGVFDWIVPFLVASASVLLIAQPRIARWHGSRPRRGTGLAMLVAVAGVSVYSGYFGAGAGILILSMLLLLAEPDLARANALKNVLLMIADLVPAVIFGLAGPVEWVAAISLALGSLLGGLVGPRIMRRVPSGAMRIAIGVCGFALTGWLIAGAAG